MRAVGAESERAFWGTQIGEMLPVVWEEHDGERWRGLSDNYIRVFAGGSEELALAGSLGGVILESVEPTGVWGRMD